MEEENEHMEEENEDREEDEVPESYPFNDEEFEFLFESVQPEADVDDGERGVENEQPTQIEEEQLHDVEVEVETERQKKRIREDEAELVDSDYAQSEDDYMPEKKGKTTKDKTGAESSRVAEGLHYDSEIEWSNDELSSSCESDHDVSHHATKTRTFTLFNPQTDMKNPRCSLGMVFPSADDFEKAIREYSNISKRGIQFKQNENRTVRAVCK